MNYLATIGFGITGTLDWTLVAARGLKVLSILVLLLHSHIIILNNNGLCQLVPLVHHGLSGTMRIGGEELAGFCLGHGAGRCGVGG